MALTKVTYSMIKGNVVDVTDFGADSTGVTDSTSAIQAAINSLSATGGVVLLPAGEYLYSDNLIIRANNIQLKGLGNVRLVADSTTSEAAIIFGIHISAEDTRPDNMPFYPRSDTFDPDNFSPSKPGYLRYSNVGLENVTIHRKVNGLALGFLRVDNFTCRDVNITFENTSITGANVVRVFYATFGDVSRLNIGQANTTFGVFTYWSYSVVFDQITTKGSSAQVFEFKYGMNCVLQNSTIENLTGTIGLTVVYGSFAVTIENTRIKCATGVGMILQASDEFDYLRNIFVNNCTISGSSQALRVSRIAQSKISNCGLFGSVSVLFFANAFATATSDFAGFTPALNSAPFTYDGNYDFTSSESGGVTRYLEWRPYPAMLDSVIENCTFGGTSRSIQGQPSASESNFYFTGTVDGGGKLKTFDTIREIPDTLTNRRLWFPAYTYMDNTYPNSIQNCVFANNSHNGTSFFPDIDLQLALNTCKFDALSIISSRSYFLDARYVYNTEFESVVFSDKMTSGLNANMKIDRAINVTIRDSQLYGANAVLNAVNGVTTNDAYGPINYDNCTFVFDTTIPSAHVLTIDGGANIDTVWVGVPVSMKNCNLVSLAGTDISSGWSQSHDGTAPSWDSAANRQYGLRVESCNTNNVSHVFRFDDAAGAAPLNRPNYFGEYARNINVSHSTKTYLAVSGYRSPSDTVLWAQLT